MKTIINNQQSCEKQTETILMIKAKDKTEFLKYKLLVVPVFCFNWVEQARSRKSDKIVKIWSLSIEPDFIFNIDKIFKLVQTYILSGMEGIFITLLFHAREIWIKNDFEKLYGSCFVSIGLVETDFWVKTINKSV